MKRISAIVIFLFLLLSVTGGLAQELMIISEENPPFNFIKDGIFTGSSTEVVREIMRRLNLPGEIQVLPWARAYQLALSQPNVVLFSTARTTEREHLFHWVGPIYKVRFGFYARKGSGLYLSCLAVAKKWQATLDEMKREGTFRKISQQWLPEESIPRIRPVAAKSGIAPVTLRIYTENSPPANYLDQGNLKGRSVEIVREILHRLKLPDNIQAVPWARGYTLALTESDAALFSTTRLPQREKLFKWVGPLYSQTWGFYAKRDSALKINSLAQAKTVSRIGTYYKDAKEQYLLANGFQNLVSTKKNLSNIRHLMDGSIDLWVSSDFNMPYLAKQAGLNPDQLKLVFPFKRVQNYIAFSIQSPDSLVNLWQQTLDELKQDGTYDRLCAK